MPKSVIRKTLKAAEISAILASLAFGGLASASYYSSEISPKIESRAQLDALLEEEKKKLKCSKEIKVELFGSPIPHGIKKEDGTYEIKLNGNLATESILKHELYHVCDEHIDGGYSFLKYFLWYEPQALMYGTWGWEL